MPDDYVCDACQFKFSVGWFHYHVSDAAGFIGETKAVCGFCGLIFAIRHAYEGDEIFTDVGGQRHWTPIRVTPEMRPPSLDGRLQLEEVVCPHCKSKGSIISSEREMKEICPRCHEPRLTNPSSWLT